MNTEYTPILQLAEKTGKRKQSIFKIVKKLEIESILMQGENSRGQKVAYIKKADETRILEYLRESDIEENEFSIANDKLISDDQMGVFYLIQLEPEHDPLRVKFGFTVNLSDRLRHHKCSAPYAEVIKTWPCKLLWEKTAIDCISKDCFKIYTEVFRSKIEIKLIADKLDIFFKLMNS